MPHVKDFAVAASLFDEELEQQIAESARILRFLEGIEKPVSEEWCWLSTSMWYGHEYALALHGMILLTALVKRGRNPTEITPTALNQIGLDLERAGAELIPPPWLGDLDVHRSHRSQLIMRTPAYADIWPNTPERMPVLWPQILSTSPQSSGYRLRLSALDLRRLKRGTRVLPEWLRYDRHAREVVPT